MMGCRNKFGMTNRTAIIIGAGIAGIATAIRLAVKGYEVEVFEANSYPGGKLSEIHQNGYRFDAGPSLLTMPQYIDELFTLAGVDPRQQFNYQKLDKVCRYFYADGATFDAHADEAKLMNEVAQLADGDTVNVKKYLKNSANIYAITDHVFLQRSLHRLKTYLSWDTLKSVFRFGQIDAFRSMPTECSLQASTCCSISTGMLPIMAQTHTRHRQHSMSSRIWNSTLVLTFRIRACTALLPAWLNWPKV
jgi:phytoene dehydrogenase-like protein